MTQILRPAMYRKMLGAGRCLHIVLIVSLQPFYKPHAESGRQIGVFSKRLMPPAPSRVSENIHIRRPESQPFINIKILKFLLCIELRPALCGNGIRHFFKKILVKRSRKRNCLRKNGSRSRSRHAVKRLIPPVISFDSQSFYGRRAMYHLKRFLLQCHLCDQTTGTFFKFCILDLISYKLHSCSSHRFFSIFYKIMANFRTIINQSIQQSDSTNSSYPALV